MIIALANRNGNIIPRAHTYVKESVAQKNNPLGLSASRSSWAKQIVFDEDADYTFFAGCGYQTMKYSVEMINAAKRMQKVGISMDATMGFSSLLSKTHIDMPGFAAKILSYGKTDQYTDVLIRAVSVLKKLGLKIDYLGDDEPCCGSPLYYSGYVKDFEKNAERFIKTISEKGKKHLIGLIPACTNSIKTYYQKLNVESNFEIRHFIEVVAERIRNNKIRMALSKNMKVTYHDPCQLSRYLEIVEEPRFVMSKIEGLELVEAEKDHIKKWSSCCGGGGGLEVVSPELSEKIAVKRVKQLIDTGASTIVTCCPFCILQLRNGVKKLNSNVNVIDLAELIDDSLQ